MNNFFIKLLYIGEVRLISFGCARFRMGASGEQFYGQPRRLFGLNSHPHINKPRLVVLDPLFAFICPYNLSVYTRYLPYSSGFRLVGQQHKQQLPRSITDDLSLFPDLFNAYKRSMQKTHSRDNFLR